MILGMDIGGTCVKMGLIDEEGHIHGHCQASADFDGYQTPLLKTAITEAKRFLECRAVEIDGIGISATGQIDADAGVVIGTNGMIPNYESVCIKREVERAFRCPVYVLNDANAAVLGESFAGSAKGFRNVVMITIGTGIGGGIMIDGKLYGGMRGIAGEIGQLYTDGGTFEQRASVTALIAEARRHTGQTGLDGRAIFECAEAGDGILQDVINQWIDRVARGMAGLIHVFNPELLLIGGGVSAQEAGFIKPLKARVLEYTMPCFAAGLRIKRAALGNSAGMVGAAKYFMDRIHSASESL